MEDFSKSDLVAASLTALQFTHRVSCWQPPPYFSDVVFDICTRFCGLSMDAAVAFVERASKRKDTWPAFTIACLMNVYGLSMKQAIGFYTAMLSVQLKEVLETLDSAALKEIIKG